MLLIARIKICEKHFIMTNITIYLNIPHVKPLLFKYLQIFNLLCIYSGRICENKHQRNINSTSSVNLLNDITWDTMDTMLLITMFASAASTSIYSIWTYHIAHRDRMRYPKNSKIILLLFCYFVLDLLIHNTILLSIAHNIGSCQLSPSVCSSNWQPFFVQFV